MLSTTLKRRQVCIAILKAKIEALSRSIAEGEDSIIGGIGKEDSRIETISIKDRIIRRRTWKIKKRNLSHKQQITDR
jgi:hypothetical protein